MKEPQYVEPEVLPPGSGGRRPHETPSVDHRWRPAKIGLLLDLLDFLTFGPLGLRFGFVLGAIAGFALLASLRIPWRWRIPLALAAGIYCAMPGTSFLPLGTLVGTYLRFK